MKLESELRYACLTLRRFFLCENSLMRALENNEDVYFWTRHYIRAAYMLKSELRVSEHMPTLEYSLKPRVVRH